MKAQIKIGFIAFFLALLIPASALSNSLITTNRAVPFELPDIQGTPHKLEEWKSKVIVLNFWATWCPPCLKEIPDFIKLQEKYQGKGLQFIGVAVDEASEVEKFIKVHSINYPILVGGLDASDISFQYGNRLGTLPFSVIINRKGVVVSRQSGPLSSEKLESIILPLL